MKLFKSGFTAFGVLCCALILSGCGSSASSDSSDSDDSVDPDIAVNAYPQGLAIASPFAGSGGASSSLNGTRAVTDDEEAFDAEEDDDAVDFGTKQERFDAIINADSLEGCFNFRGDLARETRDVECYGPELTLSGTHPDGPINQQNSRLPHGDLGIWEETEADGEACLPAKVNAEFYSIEARTDFAMMMAASVVCVARNSDIELPDTGETIDLSDEVGAAMASNSRFVAPTTGSLVVSLARQADSAEGRPVYQVAFTGELTVPAAEDDEDSDDEATIAMTMRLTHIPLDDQNATYRGLLTHRLVSSIFSGSNCGNTGENTAAASILYDQDSATSLKVRFKQAIFCGEADDEDLFADDGELDNNHKYSGCPGGNVPGEFSENGWGDVFTEVVYNVNPQTGLGGMTYAWQAGRCDQNTRVFNAELGTDGETESGCGYFGYGPDIAEDGVGTIDGLICNWTAPGAGPFGNKTMSTEVQQQCYSRAAGSDDIFVSDADTLAIAYSPTNSCDNTGGALLCDGVACPISSDLLPASDMDFEAPTAPDAL